MHAPACDEVLFSLPLGGGVGSHRTGFIHIRSTFFCAYRPSRILTLVVWHAVLLPRALLCSYLLGRHLVSEMRTTPLPPTWTAVATTSNDQPAVPEYVNRVSGERTQEHPGTSYFVSLVEQERCGNGHRGLGTVSVLSAPSLQAPSHGCRNSSSGSAGVMICTRSSSIRGPPQQEGGIPGAVSSISTDGDGTDEGLAVTSSGSDRARYKVAV